MIVRTYKELIEYIEMFKNQNADLLIIMSRGGLGKTTLVKKIMKDKEYVSVSTHATPLDTYLTLYEKQDCPVVFDDLDAIFHSPILVSLLKSLADTSPIKELHYNTTSKLIGNAPKSFKTASNVCILLNEFDVHNKSLAPIIDRGYFIEFKPDRKEILAKIKEISECQNIPENEKCVYGFIEEHYKKIEKLSIRTYIKAIQLYRDNKKNWKEKFMRMIGFDEKIIDYLILKDKYDSDKKRIDKFRWSRRTYYRIKQEVEEE